MKFYCYILFSQKLNKFYIGATSVDPHERLDKHLNKKYGSDSFTAAANDWKIFHTITCDSFKQALDIEKHIKRMKSKKYILNLVTYPEIALKLLKKYA